MGQVRIWHASAADRIEDGLTHCETSAQEADGGMGQAVVQSRRTRCWIAIRLKVIAVMGSAKYSSTRLKKLIAS